MLAVKKWFLEKNELNGMYGKELTATKETEKAVLVEYHINGRMYTQWLPKSVLIDEWEKDTSNFGYHEYLVKLDGETFSHQLKTKQLQEKLNNKNVAYMSRVEWNNR